MEKTSFIAEPGKQEITISRLFDAPRDLVFKVYTDPNLIPRWWGPKYLSTFVEKMEVRPGGMWRYIQHDSAGAEFAFRGVYHEVLPPARITFTFEYEGMPGHIMLETVALEDVDGKTRMIDKSVFQSLEDRDGMLAEGMQGGAEESVDRMAELLAEFISSARR